MVSQVEVEMAYRLILGREPENADVIARHAQTYPDVQAMRLRFLQSAEFQRSQSSVASDPGRNASVIRPWNQPAACIETDATPELVNQLTRHVEQTWTKLGETEPHWSVLIHDAFRTGQIGLNEAAFFESGEIPVAMFLQALGRSPVDVSGHAEQTCFELGCGVGRITAQLARRFQRVIAADISAAHLAVGKQAVARAERFNVDFVHLTSIQSIRELPYVDAFISVIVLQHNPPPLMKMLLRLCLQRLRPGGVGYFQFPYYIPSYSFIVADYLERITGADEPGDMEMHVLPQAVAFEAVARAGCQVLEVREDSWCGDGINSCSMLVQRI